MCPEEGAAWDRPPAELADLHKTAERLRDLAAYLANHDLEHEAAYVMMAFKRVYARLAMAAIRGTQEPSVAA